MNPKLATTALVVLLAAPAAFSQGTTGGAVSAAPAAAPTRLGVLNVRAAIVTTAEGKQASAELQSQFAPRQTELENLRKQVQDAQAKAQLQTTPEDERQRLARQIDVWSRTFQRKQQELQEDVQAAENDVADRIGRKLLEIVDRYSRENGFAVVIDVSAQSTPVIYASNQVDLTQDVIRLYDAANPVRGTAPAASRPAAQPGQTRPQQPPPVKPPVN
jgi:outer membrane protein